MNDRFRFRAGFKVCYYDEDGNDKELLVKVNDCYAIENGGDAIIINEDIIKDFIKDLSTAEQNSVWEYMQANFDETNDYWFIDKLKYLDQCTGLQDRNGRLIYEGDIVNLSSDREVVCSVVWDNEKTGFCVEYKKELYRFNTYRKYHLIEVIGNIHENKDLLK